MKVVCHCTYLLCGVFFVLTPQWERLRTVVGWLKSKKARSHMNKNGLFYFFRREKKLFVLYQRMSKFCTLKYILFGNSTGNITYSTNVAGAFCHTDSLTCIEQVEGVGTF